MATSIGLVGLPNVGKTTVFNALASAAAPAESYPFCTVEKNVAAVAVPDAMLEDLARLLGPEEVVPTTIEVIDIAGLVEGASKGEGLGNKFLEDIRSVDAVFHVVRCFGNPHVAHVAGSSDPVRDLELVDTELVLADLEVAVRRLAQERRKAKSLAGATSSEVHLYEQIKAHLARDKALATMDLSSRDWCMVQGDRFLTAKPSLVVANVDEDVDDISGEALEGLVAVSAPRPVAPFPAGLEAELAPLDAGEKEQFLQELGLEESKIPALLRAGFDLLGLITFYTMARNKLHAWRIRKGSSALEAAGRIHSDMAAGFIRADVFTARDLLAHGTVAELRSAGRLRSEGKDYKICDADVLFIHFRT